MKTVSPVCSESDVRAVLSSGLRARRDEIEEETLIQIEAIQDSKTVTDSEYADGLNAAVTAAIDFGLVVVERGELRAPDVPFALLAQTRLAARSELDLGTVLRRCVAGYALLNDFLIQEAEKAEMSCGELTILLRDQQTIFNRLLVDVEREFVRENHVRSRAVETSQRGQAQGQTRVEIIPTSDIPHTLKDQPLIEDVLEVDWAALASFYIHPRKLQIIEALRYIGHPLSPSDLEKVFSAKPTISNVEYHLKSLADVGIVEQLRGRHGIRGNDNSKYQLAKSLLTRVNSCSQGFPLRFPSGYLE